MEIELEAMMVGAWVNGDRAKLFLRVKALERELSLVESGRQLEREAFETQRAVFARRIAETEEELRGVVKELSLKANGEEKLRRICQRRLQELEGEAMLLGEQLNIAEAKFRETENALRRERATNLSRQCSLDGNEPTLTHRARRVGQDRYIAPDSNRFNPLLASTPCSGGSHRWDRPECEGDDGEIRLRDDLTEEAGELKVVEALVAGLLEENAQLGSTVEQLQNGSGEAGVGAQHCGQDDTALREAGALELAAAAITTTVNTTQQEDATTWAPKPTSDAVPLVNPIITVAPIESRKRRDWRKGGDGHRDSDAKVQVTVEVAEGTVVEDGNVDMANALAKIRALTGMTRVQEEIEKLLGQELCELKKTAEERERLWRLLIRWKGALEATGYSVGNDIRSAGLLKQLRQRVTETRRQDWRRK